MSLQGQQVISLYDGQGRDLGRVVVERVEGDLVFGRFTPGPHYPAVASLFAEFIEAANQQLLSVVGELDATIRALGLHLVAPGYPSLPAIEDVQIGDGVITFRVQPRPSDPPLPDAATAACPPPAPTRPDVPTA